MSTPAVADTSPLAAPPLRLVPSPDARIWTAESPPRRTFRILRSTLEQIRGTTGSFPAETGGLLGGSRLDGIVRRFHLDGEASATCVTYSPRHETLTALLQHEWNPRGDQLLGVVHSHPPGLRRPSLPDVTYAQRFLAHNADLDEMLVPIVTSSADAGEFGISAFAVRRGSPAVPLELEVLPDPPSSHRAEHAVFERVRGAYDLRRMARTRLVVVGVGGAAQFVEDMCRAGVGEIVLIDPDTVESRNAATQMVSLDDVGRPKVQALADRLTAVSPQVVVGAVHANLDALSDVELERLATRRLAGRPRPEVTLLCGFTDDFWAQARVARLGLHLGLPTLAAQVYREGRGAEVTFALPGVTPACQRCALGGRYRAFLDGDGRPPEVVGSTGTPIFATARLNALKGFVALALIHGAGSAPATGKGGQRWVRLLERIGPRNLIVVRLDPDLGETLRLGVFDRVFGGADQDRLLFDETVWLPQEPENERTGYPPCGDCGGTGNLLDAVGTLPHSQLEGRQPR